MITLKIVQLGKIPNEIIDAVTKELRNNFNIITDISTTALPKEFYNALRNQYRADSVLQFLMKFKTKTLGITDQDLYTENLNFIFGQAQLNGDVAVVSIARLDPTFFKQSADKNLLIERAVKEVVHEVCHMLFGLTHCENSKCVMSFSNTIFDVDKKRKDLCKNCKLQLS